ncbi:cyclic nucleotide-binding domain-containing protein [Elongatibacter sediminis]|uniref:Cyclic nucleotide-binding domain-containing protein n=1 Tax=Elongatibacter sediminis TaxID=3119006 RepID=A0AAW9RGL3_9GAMM
MNFLRLFANWDDVHEFEPDSVIFSDTDTADAVYVVLDGTVELRLRGEPLCEEGKGSILGELALSGSPHRSAVATARTPVRLARLERDRFESMIGRHPEFALHVMSALANRLRSVDSFISTHIGKTD